jgi:hypothetical protein
MKNLYFYLLLFFLGFTTMKVEANIKTGAVSDLDTNLIIIHRNSEIMYSPVKEMVTEKFSIYATMPDTSIDIIIIARRICFTMQEFESKVNKIANSNVENLSDLPLASNLSENDYDYNHGTQTILQMDMDLRNEA